MPPGERRVFGDKQRLAIECEILSLHEQTGQRLGLFFLWLAGIRFGDESVEFLDLPIGDLRASIDPSERWRQTFDAKSTAEIMDEMYAPGTGLSLQCAERFRLFATPPFDGWYLMLLDPPTLRKRLIVGRRSGQAASVEVSIAMDEFHNTVNGFLEWYDGMHEKGSPVHS